VPKAIAPLLIDLPKRMRSLAATAGYKAMGQETRESFKKPFQCARGTTFILHRTPGQRLEWLFGLAFLSLRGHTEHETLCLFCGLFLSSSARERMVELAVVPQCNILGCPSGRAPNRGVFRCILSIRNLARPDIFHYGAEGPSDHSRCRYDNEGAASAAFYSTSRITKRQLLSRLKSEWIFWPNLTIPLARIV
jgi:hypothetical protein